MQKKYISQKGEKIAIFDEKKCNLKKINSVNMLDTFTTEL